MPSVLDEIIVYPNSMTAHAVGMEFKAKGYANVKVMSGYEPMALVGHRAKRITVIRGSMPYDYPEKYRELIQRCLHALVPDGILID